MFVERGRAEASRALSRGESSSFGEGAQPARGGSAALEREAARSHADPRLVLGAGTGGGLEREL